MSTDLRTNENLEGSRVGVEDVMPVGSRVSWGAIIAGAVVALSVFLVLTLLGSALNLSISDRVTSGTLKTSSAVWAVLTSWAALFLGGWVVSQITVGETTGEAVLHGIVLWGVVLFMLLWLVGIGMRAGATAMWGVASFASQNTNMEDWEAAARRAGVPQPTIEEWKQKSKDAPRDAVNAAQNPENREEARRYARQATWYTLVGMLLSMGSAIGGAMVGAGPAFRLVTIPVRPSRIVQGGIPVH